MKRTTNRSRIHTTSRTSFVAGIALTLALMPGMAFAADNSYESEEDQAAIVASVEKAGESKAVEASDTSDAAGAFTFTRLLAKTQKDQAQNGLPQTGSLVAAVLAVSDELDNNPEPAAELVPAAYDSVSATAAKSRELAQQRITKVLEYDRALIDQIGTQEQSGHTICCPSFSCAYADAVLDGTVHDHSYYTCYSCTWPDWGGGNSSFRSLESNDALLREAYDQIAAGRPTVVHVSAGYGEHWIALIGYQNATDPDHLTLENFIALDPWDGAQIVASERFSLYGDACEHISDR